MNTWTDKELVNVNAKTAKFYLEAVVNRIKALEQEKERRANAIYHYHRHIKELLGPSLLGVLEKQIHNDSYIRWVNEEIPKIAKEGKK